MEPVHRATDESPVRTHLHAAYVISAQSAAWTVVASFTSIVLGLGTHTTVLIAFGAIGFVDAIGSIALVSHFRHGLRHDRLSEARERLAHRIVLVGLLLVGCLAVIGGIARLATGSAGEASDAGAALAAVSLVALTVLSARKRSLAQRVSSNALRSDGHLSAIGAMQAAVTLTGIAVSRWLAWRWADAVATMVVGCAAATLAVLTWRDEARPGRTPEARRWHRDDMERTMRSAPDSVSTREGGAHDAPDVLGIEELGG